MSPVMVFFKRSTKPISSVNCKHVSGMYENVEVACSHLLILTQGIAGARFMTGALNLWPIATVYSWLNTSIMTKSNEFEFDWMNFFMFLCDMTTSDNFMPRSHFNWTDVTKFMCTNSITFLSETNINSNINKINKTLVINNGTTRISVTNHVCLIIVIFIKYNITSLNINVIIII